MFREPHEWIGGIWMAAGIFWYLTGLRLKPVVRVQNTMDRAAQLLLLAVAGILLFSTAPRLGWLELYLIPPAESSAYAGVALTACGALFAMVARLYLGGNWSARPNIKEGHQIIRRGPYALVRHPIYTGLLIAAVGTALAFGQARQLAACPILLFAFWIKSRSEERLLSEAFGASYTAYQRTVTRAIVPFVL